MVGKSSSALWFIYSLLHFFFKLKVTEHFVKYMRSYNVIIVMYLNDNLGASSSQLDAFRVS